MASQDIQQGKIVAGNQQLTREKVVDKTSMEIFYSYSHRDEALRDELEKHLSLLKRQGYITTWYDRRIVAGQEWAVEIDTHLNTAQIIPLLISPDFLASDYCYSVEVRRAVERHERGEARVIPIILRPVYWREAPFGKLQALPKDAKPVIDWPNLDDAFFDVAEGIRTAVEELMARLEASPENKHAQENLPSPSALPIPTQDHPSKQAQNADISFPPNSRAEEVQVRLAQEEKRRLPEEAARTQEERQHKEEQAHQSEMEQARQAEKERHPPGVLTPQQALRRLFGRIRHASAFFGGLVVQVADFTWFAISNQRGDNGQYLINSDPYLLDLVLLILVFDVALAVILIIMNMVTMARLKRWGWFIGLLLGSISGAGLIFLPGLALIVFGLFAPRTPRVAPASARSGIHRTLHLLERWRARHIILLVGLALFVIVGSSTGLFMVRNNQVASDNAHATVTAQANIPAQLTATANAAVTATFVARNPDPYFPNGMLVLDDQLSDNSRGLSWSERTNSSGDGCVFTGRAYHAKQITPGYFDWCAAEATDFSNFTFEVQMMIIKGGAGGIIFRADDATGKWYTLDIAQDGHYSLSRFDRFGPPTKTLAGGSTSAFKTGLNQSNLIAVVANRSAFDLYVNHEKIVSVSDSTYSHGEIGIIADNPPSEVVYSNAKVWTL